MVYYKFGSKALSQRFYSLVRHGTAALLSVFVFYTLVFVANMLAIHFYLGYKELTMHIIVFTPILDRILWSSSITLASTILVFSAYRRRSFDVLRWEVLPLYISLLGALALAVALDFAGLAIASVTIAGLALTGIFILRGGYFTWRGNFTALLAFYSLIILLIIEASSLIRWICWPAYPSPILADATWSMVLTEIQLSNLLFPLLPVLLLVFILSWVGLPYAREDRNVDTLIPQILNRFEVRFAFLVAAISMCLILSLYHFEVFRMLGRGFLSVDALMYTKHLGRMVTAGSPTALNFAATDDRFLYLVFQYFVSSIVGDSSQAFVAFTMPGILAFLYTLSSFTLVRAGNGFLPAGTIALLAPLSFTLTVGLYAGFYANWFALVLTHLSMALIFISFRSSGWKFPVLATLTSVSVLYTHPWTWLFLMIIHATYIIVSLLKGKLGKVTLAHDPREIKLLLGIIIVNIAMFWVRDWFGVGSGASVADVRGTRLYPDISNVAELYYNLNFIFKWHLGGFYAHPPAYVLSILGVISILNLGGRFSRLLLAWLLAASLMFFVDLPMHGRFLYLIPFNVYTGIGTMYLIKLVVKHASKVNSRLALILGATLYILIVLLFLNYALRCVAVKQFGPIGLQHLTLHNTE